MKNNITRAKISIITIITIIIAINHKEKNATFIVKKIVPLISI